MRMKKKLKIDLKRNLNIYVMNIEELFKNKIIVNNNMDRIKCFQCEEIIIDLDELNLISFDNNIKFFMYCEKCGLKFSRIKPNHPKFKTDEWEDVFNLYDSGKIEF